VALDPRAPRTAKHFPGSRNPAEKAAGYNQARFNLAPQWTAADTLDVSFNWLDQYLSTGTVELEALQATVHSCRGYRRACNAHLNEASRDASRTPPLTTRSVVVRDRRRVRT
jgi:hypothetical protein